MQADCDLHAASITAARRRIFSNVILLVSERRTRAVPAGTVGGRMAFTAKPFACSSRGDMQRRFVRAQDHGHDLRGARAEAQAHSGKLFAQRGRDFAQMSAVGVRLAGKLERRTNLAGEIRRHRRAENKRPRAIDRDNPSARRSRRRTPPRSPAPSRMCERSPAFRARSRSSAASPRPCGPQTPVACASSTISSASYLRASAHQIRQAARHRPPC